MPGIFRSESFYAEQLNYRDGGERIPFASAQDWMERLASLKKRKEPTT